MRTIPQPTTDHDERPTSVHPIALLVGDHSEADLIQRCKAGDASAWDTLIGRYEKSIYNFAYSLCHNRDDAEDITGQVFLRIYQRLHAFRNESRFATWLFRIVSNIYQDLCIRPAHRGILSLNVISAYYGEPSLEWDIPDLAPSPETICIENETARILARAIHHLPAYQQNAMRMYYIENKSYQEIAEATGFSIGTIKSRLNRARTMLRERLAMVQNA